MGDQHVPRQYNGQGWEQPAVKTAGSPSLETCSGFDGALQAIDNKQKLFGRNTPKRSKSLHGLINTKSNTRKESSHHAWKAGSNNSKEPPQDTWEPSYRITWEHSPGSPSAPCRWLRRCMSTTIGRRHRFHNTSTATAGSAPIRDSPEMLQIPGIGVEPPQVPDSTTSGAAARAAAAAQNQILRSSQNTRLAEPKVARDSESGIGIEVRDGGGENSETAIPVVRRGLWPKISIEGLHVNARTDPASILPEELVAQILSYLDATSLIYAELVSRRWQISAGSNRIWRNVFRGEFEEPRQSHQTQLAAVQVGGQGLGKNIGDQDWKEMWRARKALQQRWTDGHAAAIYLEGHTDCVYCVQFDEYGTESHIPSYC